MRLLGALLMAFSLISAEETVSVPVSQLTAQQKAAYQTQQVAQAVQTVDTIGKFAKEFRGVGREVGETMREGFSALTDGVNDFAKTDAGKFTAIVIAWKVCFKDIMDLGSRVTSVFVGLLIFAVMMGALIWSYRRTCIPYKMLKSEKKDLDEKGKIKSVTKDYVIVNDLGRESHMQGRQGLHLVALGVLLIIIPLIIFGCPMNG